MSSGLAGDALRGELHGVSRRGASACPKLVCPERARGEGLRAVRWALRFGSFRSHNFGVAGTLQTTVRRPFRFSGTRVGHHWV